MAQKLTRVVTGNKSYHGINAHGKRQAFQPGEEVHVTPNQAKAFRHCLEDSAVAKAKAAALEAEAKALAEANETQAAIDKSDAVDAAEVAKAAAKTSPAPAQAAQGS